MKVILCCWIWFSCRKTELMLIFFCTISQVVLPAESKCECFDEFQAEMENEEELCRGIKNYRIFQCGEEQPPICQCRLGTVVETLDIGETSCTKPDKQYDSIFCEPKDIWDQYLSRHPNRRIYFSG